MKNKNILSLCLVAGLTLCSPSLSHSAGIPVIDATNLKQNVLSAVESVKQTLKQIEQYVLQLKQYEDMVKNSLAPVAYVWDQAQQTINQIMGLQDQLEYYMNQAGSIDTYLAKFGDVNYYSNSPYFNAGGGTDEQREKLMESEKFGSEAQKYANDNVVKSLQAQQKAMKQDAANLERIQSNAQSVVGRMQAIQTANQLASLQANQLLQLRALFTAQLAAENARAQTITAREARQQAADKKALESRYEKSSKRNWANELF